MATPPSPVKVVLSHAPEDEKLSLELDKHLSVLRSEGMIDSFRTGAVGGGQVLDEVVHHHLDRAEVILLLVSVDFISSPRAEADIARALARQRAGQAQVIPVLLRDCDYQDASFGELKALPKNLRPVNSWPDPNEAFADVARGIREVVHKLLAERSPGSIPPPSRAPARVEKVKQVLQELGKPSVVGVAILAPFGFHKHQIAGEVLRRLQRPDEPLFPVRLVPDIQSTTEERLYDRLLRDLRRAVPEALCKVIDGHTEKSMRARFEDAVEDLLDGPVQEAGRTLLLAVDGLAHVPADELAPWAYLMARLSQRGLKILVWGEQDLHELLTQPDPGNFFSAFHLLTPISLEALTKDEVAEIVAARGGDLAARALVHKETGGHPALVYELVDRYLRDVRNGDREALAARILSGDHLERLRRMVDGDAAAQGVLRSFAGVLERPFPRGRRAGEERLLWLGVLKDAGATRWDWVAPVMQRFAGKWG